MSKNLYHKCIKLTSGDNIICTIASDNNNVFRRKTVRVYNPVVLSPLRIPRGSMLVESYIMYPWFSFSSDISYEIPTTQILLVTGIQDKLKENYVNYIMQKENEETVDDEYEYLNDMSDETITEELAETLVDEYLDAMGDINEDQENFDVREGHGSGANRRNSRTLH